ncbi:MAG: hypothetical protein ACTSPB_06740 [Candidatus Thorarchaeota archaeon]
MTEKTSDKDEIISKQAYRIAQLEYTTAMIDVIMERINPVLDHWKDMSYPELGREMYFLCSAIQGFRNGDR